MKINTAISTLRAKLGEAKGFNDDSLLTDSYLYSILLDSASIVFHRYKEKFYKISDFSFSTFGVKLQMVGADMFPCEAIEHCMVLESVNTIPDSLVSRNKLMLQVYNGKTELPEYKTSNEFDEYLKTKPSWEIVNGKLRIHNIKTLKAVTIRTIPANPMEWLDLKYCPSTDTVECYNLDELDFNILADRKFASMSYDLALQSLGLKLNEVEENNQH